MASYLRMLRNSSAQKHGENHSEDQSNICPNQQTLCLRELICMGYVGLIYCNFCPFFGWALEFYSIRLKCDGYKLHLSVEVLWTTCSVNIKITFTSRKFHVNMIKYALQTNMKHSSALPKTNPATVMAERRFLTRDHRITSPAHQPLGHAAC